jgi:hypothetical protein
VGPTLAFLATITFALGTVLPQKGTLDTTNESGDSSWLIQILHRPVWLAGMLLQASGWILQNSGARWRHSSNRRSTRSPRLVLWACSHWRLCALVVAAVAGTLLQQSALPVGPLSVSQPLPVVTDPFATIVLNVWLFDEHVTDSPWNIAVAVLAFVVMAGGVVFLSRTAPPISRRLPDPDRDQRRPWRIRETGPRLIAFLTDSGDPLRK